MVSPPDPPPPRDSRLGRLLGGKWRLDRQLGLGGMATVYAATHRNGTTAAVKVLHPDCARDPEIRDRFMREGYIANASGPGAVRVLDDDIDEDGAPYLVMELLEGETMDVRAKRSGGRLPPADVLWVASETLGTLAVAHRNGIVHRDLKPANLFWTTDNAVKLLDFGVARLRVAGRERTHIGHILGTAGYMAPEQARGASAEIDARTDVWGVGAIMFRLLTGQRVHEAKTPAQIVMAATVKARSLGTAAPELPAAIVDIVDAALALRPADRFPTAASMRDAILLQAEAARIPLRRSRVDLELTRTGGAEPQGAQAPPPREVAAHRAVTDVSAYEFPPLDVIVEADPPPALSPEPEPGPVAEPGFVTGMSDEDTVNLRALLAHVEIAALTHDQLEAKGTQRAQYASRLGALRRLEVAHEHATRALGTAHIGLFWNVLPEGFATKHGLIWAARPPLAEIAARMYDDGVRMLGILPGVTLDEIGRLVQLMRREIAPFSDYATFLQVTPLPHLVHRIDPTRPGAPEHPSLSIEVTLGHGVNVPAMLDALADRDPALRAAVLSRLARVAAGQEAVIGARIAEVDDSLAIGLLRVLDTMGTDAARDAIQRAARSSSVLVRVEALSRLEPERVRRELESAFETESSAVRIDLLAAVGAYRIDGAAPFLARRIRGRVFDLLPIDERRQALATLTALSPALADEVAFALADESSGPATPGRQATRELARRLVGVGRPSEAPKRPR